MPNLGSIYDNPFPVPEHFSEMATTRPSGLVPRSRPQTRNRRATIEARRARDLNRQAKPFHTKAMLSLTGLPIPGTFECAFLTTGRLSGLNPAAGAIRDR